jgi:gliding motility-associated-like protein
VREDYAEVFWDFGDSTYSREFKDAHLYDSAGLYRARLKIHNLCLDTYDSLEREIVVTPPLQVQTLPDTVVCAGISLRLRAEQAPEGATIHWSGPNGFESDLRNPLLARVNPPQAGEYTVLAQGGQCFSLPSSFTLKVNDPHPELGKDTTLCPGDFFVARVRNPKAHLSYRWQDGSRQTSFRLKQSGTYWVEAVDSLGCRSRDSLGVRRKCPPAVFLPDFFTPNNDRFNDLFRAWIDIVPFRFSLKVFNEQGELVFQSQNPGLGWKGEALRSGKAPEGLYRWELSFYEQEPTGPRKWEHEGWVYLIRE